MITSVRVLLGFCIFCLLGACLASAQMANLSSVQDGSGTMSSGGTFTNWSAAGQPGGIATSAGGTYTNHAGFLQAVDIKRGSQDTDGDGIADELDSDNDADGLSDSSEVGGGSFSPSSTTAVNNPDSDGDGVIDGWEASAETDPNNPNANLRILSISNVPGGKQITYMARADKNYTIRSWEGGFAHPTNALGTDVESGGSGVWQVRTNTYQDASTAATGRYYAVQPGP